MKKLILKIVIIVVALLVTPVTFLVCGFATGSKYGETYYGELAPMVSRLKGSQKKKIVIIGNSAVAFGVDSALVEQELALDGLDYDVCNFGLYGSIGTKAMMELSEDYIREGDIVLFSPELSQQSMSLYFSAKEMWYAVDSDFSLLTDLSEEGSRMFGAYPEYVVNKIHAGEVNGTGVYAKASFDDHCDMKNADRGYNIMVDGCDPNNIFSTDIVWADDFTAYVNDYYATIRKKGADMLYSFAPMNRKALPSDCDSFVDDLYQKISEKLDFLVLGNPHDAVMDYEWFYDSNVHLNASGMQVRTISLVNDLKLYFQKLTPVTAVVPAKPAIPEEEKKEEEIDTSLFLYETNDNGIIITGLTEEAKKQKTLTVPSSAYAFDKTVFQNDAVLEELTIPSGVRVLYDESFQGCTSLKKLILLQENPEKLSVGYSLLEGAPSCKIYVSQTAFSAYSSNYFWGHYADVLETI